MHNVSTSALADMDSNLWKYQMRGRILKRLTTRFRNTYHHSSLAQAAYKYANRKLQSEAVFREGDNNFLQRLTSEAK